MSGMKGLVAILTISAATVSSGHAKILRGPYGSKDEKWCKKDCEFFKGCTDYHFEDKKCTLYRAEEADEPEGNRPCGTPFPSADPEWCKKECKMTPGCKDHEFFKHEKECVLSCEAPHTPVVTPPPEAKVAGKNDEPDEPEGNRPCGTPFPSADPEWCKKECNMTPGCKDHEFFKHEKECVLSCEAPHTPPVTPPAVTPPTVTPPAVTPPAVTPPAVTPPKGEVGGETEPVPPTTLCKPFFADNLEWCLKACTMAEGCDKLTTTFDKGSGDCTLGGPACAPPPPPPHATPAPKTGVPGSTPPSPAAEVKACVIGETFIVEDKKWCMKACGLTPECHDVQYMDKECTCNEAPASPSPHRKFGLSPELEAFKKRVWKW